MRSPTWSALLVSCSLLFPMLGVQEDEGTTPNPLRGYDERSRSSLESQLEGLWMLRQFDDPANEDSLLNVSGFAMFTSDGYLSIHMQGATRADTFFGERADFWAQSELQRYRIDSFGRLQTASMLGFNNLNDSGDIDPFPSEAAREHELTLNGSLLELRHSGGVSLHFTRAGRGEFPPEAIRFLDGLRAGDFDYPEEDLGGEQNR